MATDSLYCTIKCYTKFPSLQQNTERAAINERSSKILETAQEIQIKTIMHLHHSLPRFEVFPSK